MTISKKTFTFACIYLPTLLSLLLLSLSGYAQEATTESLNLPEVVITGIEQLRIQRELPKVAPQTPLFIVTEAVRDRSDALLREADRLALRQGQKAVESYLQALTLDPSNTRALLCLATVSRALGRDEFAARAYESALEISSDLAEAHYHLGILYETHAEKRAQAIQHYRAYLKLDGTDRRVRLWIRNLEREGISPTNQISQ